MWENFENKARQYIHTRYTRMGSWTTEALMGGILLMFASYFEEVLGLRDRLAATMGAMGWNGGGWKVKEAFFFLIIQDWQQRQHMGSSFKRDSVSTFTSRLSDTKAVRSCCCCCCHCVSFNFKSPKVKTMLRLLQMLLYTSVKRMWWFMLISGPLRLLGACVSQTGRKHLYFF